MSDAFQNWKVFLELQRRNELGGADGSHANRIPLFVDSITISTNKTVPNMGVPLAGMVRGESMKLAFDIGMAEKSLNMSGILLEQTITKQSTSDNLKTRKLTSYEMAQLIHSYVDGSSMQDDQNLSKIIILIPSRADHNFEYHDSLVGNATAENDDLEDLPLIPFTWKNRIYDNAGTALVSGGVQEFTAVSDAVNADGKKLEIDGNAIGITGFIRSFQTTITGAESPAIQFTLDFEEARVMKENFLS